jgi:hypothetical protein
MAAVSIKNVNTICSVKLTYSLIQFLDLPLFILLVVMCIQTSIVEVFDPESQVPVTCVQLSSVGECCKYTELMFVDNL